MADVPAHWQKIIDLIALADQDSEVADTLQSGTPREVAALLDAQGITEDDLLDVYEDDFLIGAERNGKYWRW